MLGVCAKAELRIDVQFYTRILMILVQRSAPAVQVRLALNMGIPKDGKSLPIFPPDAENEEEEIQAMEDGEKPLELQSRASQADALSQLPIDELRRRLDKWSRRRPSEERASRLAACVDRSDLERLLRQVLAEGQEKQELRDQRQAQDAAARAQQAREAAARAQQERLANAGAAIDAGQS